MSLPTTWVDRIFEKLALVYGREFTERWKGLSIADVKTDWSHELAGFAGWPEAIAYALHNMPPDRAPTVLQFREICRKAPPKAVLALPEPKADRERVEAELAKLGGIVRKQQPRRDHREWARKIIASPDGRTPTALQMAKDALRINDNPAP